MLHFYNMCIYIISKQLTYQADPKILIPAIPGCIIITFIRKFLIKKFKIIANMIVRKDKNWPDRDTKVDKV